MVESVITRDGVSDFVALAERPQTNHRGVTRIAERCVGEIAGCAWTGWRAIGTAQNPRSLVVIDMGEMRLTLDVDPTTWFRNAQECR